MNEITIGRSANNKVVLTDKSVSNYHAKFILKNDGTLWIKDLNSTNGTFVNDVRIENEQSLTPSDSIRFGLFQYNWQEELLSSEKDSNTTLIPREEEVSKDNVITAEEVFTKRSNNDHLEKKISIFITVILVLGGLFMIVNGWGKWGNSDDSGDTNTQEENDSTTTNNSKIEKSDGKNYNLECLNDGDGISDILVIGNEIKKSTTELADVTVTIEEEEKVGREAKDQVDNEYTYSSDIKYKSRIDKIITTLLKSLGKTKYKYKWFVIQSDEINAFTAGGYIFITTGIIDFAENDDEIACVIGHEIYHNELGHIHDKIKEQKAAKKVFGDEWGDVAAIATAILSTPFNQENEAYCDLYGLDLAFKAGYDGCAATNLWDRMSKKETEGGQLDKLFRSHPYSKQRSSCIHHHVETNYNGKKCNH